MEKICVVGAGQMGAGIAQSFAQAGFEVFLVDIDRDQLERGVKGIEKNLSRLIEKGKMKKEKMDETLMKIIKAIELTCASKADVVIEAVFEDEAIKMDVFRKLDEICPASTLFASNTSSISITKMAAVTKRPDKFIGTHFFNPAPIKSLVEVIPGRLTSNETIAGIEKLISQIGKEVIKAKDFPGFLSTRLGHPFFVEAVRAVHEGRGSPEDIDKIAREILGHPMGPLELIDFMGIDSFLAISEILYKAYGDPRYLPPPLLTQMVEAGHLGRKTGRGFYMY